jgi:phosphatidylglycerol:prolipoprotein diacylglycerol transferase
MLAYYVHDLNPLIFRLWDNVGPRWYGLAYVLAFVCGYAVFRLLAKRGYADLPVAKVGDFITGAALFGVILGGRLGYVLFYKPEMLREPMSILRVWEGGMSSHGGMLGIFFFALFYARRHQLSWRNLGDNLVVAAPLGLFFGRCANFINGELYGRIINEPTYRRFLDGDTSVDLQKITKLPWAMQFPKELIDVPSVANLKEIHQKIVDAAIEACGRADLLKCAKLGSVLPPRHPSQLYEAFFEGFVLFSILWFVRTRTRQPNGILIGLFFVCYAIFRIVIENFREPDASLIGGFTRGQFLSFFLIAIGLAFVIAAKLRPTFPKKMTKHE